MLHSLLSSEPSLLLLFLFLLFDLKSPLIYFGSVRSAMRVVNTGTLGFLVVVVRVKVAVLVGLVV